MAANYTYIKSTSQTRQRKEEPKDYLWLHLRDLPYFRGLLRAIEARFYADIDLPPPTLDLGCGDGHFATVAFDRPLEVGIDPWGGPIREAASRGGYKALAQANGAEIPFVDGAFASVVSNSVLEHIPEVEEVLAEIARVLQPGAPFIFCVPNHRFLKNLWISQAFDKAKLRAFGEAYRRFFNRISRHHNCDPPEVWENRLEKAGFQLERWWHYFPPAALHILEWGHYFGLPALVTRALTGRWILSPTEINLAVTRRLVQPHYRADSVSQEGVYTFYIARRPNS